MPDQRSTRQEIEQARKHPLNQHCLKLMEKEKVPRNNMMVGAPELLDWVLEQGKVELDPRFQEDLENLVSLLNCKKPQVSTKLLGENLPEMETEGNPYLEELLQAKSVKRAAEVLIDKMHQWMIDTQGSDYMPNIAPKLR